LALAPGRFGQSISKITSVPIFMLLYKFAHSLMKIPLTALTISYNRCASNLPNVFTKNTRLFFDIIYLQNHKIVGDSVHILPHNIPTRSLNTL